MNIAELIQVITVESQTSQKMVLFSRLRQEIEAGHPAKRVRLLIPLLYELNAEIRREAAYMLEEYGIRLEGEDYLQYLFAVQDFDILYRGHFDDPQVRKLMFAGFKDPNLRLRARLLNFIHESDCRTFEEKSLYYYGRAEYDQIIRWDLDEARSAGIRSLLTFGTKPENNSAYHRRACARALQLIAGMDGLSEDIAALLETRSGQRSVEPLRIKREDIVAVTELDLLLEKLSARGIYAGEQIVYPEIHVGTVTGRITYKNPALQTWPKEKRQQMIKPFDGYEIIGFDYTAIEPRLLLNLLVQEHLLNLSEIPGEDIYSALCPEDREPAKKYLISLMNGGPVMPPFNPQPFLWKLVGALDEFKSDLRERFKAGEQIQTLAGRPVDLQEGEPNFCGKLINRLIQGGAADLFNNGLIEIERWIAAENQDITLYFVIYDEVWLLVPAGKQALYRDPIRQILDRQWQVFNLVLPLTVKESGEVL
jgi:hypothetical protein